MSIFCGTIAAFSGTAQTFLYALDPKMEVFLPSGFNENYMYLNVNQQTLPNGLVRSLLCR